MQCHVATSQAACWACREALAGTRIQTPRIAVISNVDAKPHSDPDVIKEILALQASFADGRPVIN